MIDDDDPKTTQAHKDDQAQQIRSEHNNESTALRNVVDQLIALVQEIRTQREANTNERRRDRIWQRIIALGTLLVSILTLLVLIETYSIYSKIRDVESEQASIMTKQTSIMDKQREITEKTLPAIQAQANAALSSADAARTALTDTQQSFKVDQRPYVIIDAPYFVGTLVADRPVPAVNQFARDIGKAPASKVRRFIALHRFRASPISDPNGINRLVVFLDQAFTDLRKKADTKERFEPLIRTDMAPNLPRSPALRTRINRPFPQVTSKK